MSADHMLQPLAAIATGHQALWGELAVSDPEPPLILEQAVVLPAWQHRDIEPWWWRHSLGIYGRNGQHVDALSDHRGERRICFPPARLEQARFNRARAVNKRLVLYGGTLYDHFGHLLMDSARAYQLLRLYRHTKQPIWFHDCTPHRGSVLRLAMVQQWLACLGITARVRIVRRPLLADQLISGPALYSDRRFVSRDLRAACQAALLPKLRRQLEREGRPRRRLAYLSRHRLRGGSTHFAGEAALVETLADWPHVDVICPEELGFEDKIALYHRYEVVAGFPQSCMNLKLFTPVEDPALQVMLIAGRRSLSSSWVNIEHATGFGDQVVDCSCADPGPDGEDEAKEDDGFQRTNRFDQGRALTALAALAG
ncbi:glycosyltransferase 61 family protein [Cyanobium sp. CH-040]|uniref:glycosyltransferase 61 family protein n=1 Tax=Cyanobium sp. CH-040 TaxID=2823708 RepID=UPI0020CCF88C|nr:glycosyltransferase 61 family protein [Cyanobium sp. CH-040]MCP9928014.1 glycosyltransferase family 61 protein [Cyanobium sp. CH-040]